MLGIVEISQMNLESWVRSEIVIEVPTRSQTGFGFVLFLFV